MTGWLVGCLALVVAGLPVDRVQATAGPAAPGGSAVAALIEMPPGVGRIGVPGTPFETARPPAPAAPTGLAVPMPTRDRWVAEDKVRHLVASFAATGMAYGAARIVARPGDARVGAAAVGVVLGLGKELVDAHGGGTFSLMDLVWDAAGVALGYTFVQRME